MEAGRLSRTHTGDGYRLYNIIQAESAGLKLRSLLRPDDTLHFFTSPYRRTRETTEGILASLTSDNPSPSPFPRHTIKVYEEPRLREQDFGNFQPCSADMARMWQERADYGHFFYRIPNGESAADAYDRISGFNESLWRSFGEADFASVCVLVTHGLMTRVFLMKWYHFSVEYFEDLRNVNHCEFVVMKKNPENEKYILQNQLRTWSELKKERESIPQSPVPVRKKWGGSPDGYDHQVTSNLDRREMKRQNTADLFKDDGTANIEYLQRAMRRNIIKSKENDKQASRGRETSEEPSDLPRQPSESRDSKSLLKPGVNEARITSPNRLALLQTGRDGGGSQSGATSLSGSSDDEDRPRIARPTAPRMRSMAMALHGAFDDNHGMGKGVRADALGDQSDASDEDGAEALERSEGSFEGSVR